MLAVLLWRARTQRPRSRSIRRVVSVTGQEKRKGRREKRKGEVEEYWQWSEVNEARTGMPNGCDVETGKWNVDFGKLGGKGKGA